MMNANSIRTSLQLTILSAALSFLAGVGGYVPVAYASPATGTVDLLDTPPELTTTVDPNVVVTFDDSGSMMATSLPDLLSAQYGNQYYYSSSSNVIYFDPAKTYVPPSKADGTSFPNASYTAAWRDGICANAPGSYCYGAATTVDLSTRFYRRFAKITSTGDAPNANTGVDITTAVRGGSTGRYNGGFYYTCPTQYVNTGCVATYINDEPAAVKQNFANWYSYYRTRNLLARSAVTRAFNDISGDVRVAWQTINGDFSGTPALRSRAIKKNVGLWRDDFYNWIFNVVTTGNTPNRRAMMEAGRFYERALTPNDMNPYWEFTPEGPDVGHNLSCRKNFNMQVTDGYWNFATPPARPAIWQDGQTSVTLPDGRDFSTADAESRIIWDVRGAKVDTSMANIGFNYWSRDLQPTLANNVSPYLPDRSTGTTGSTPLLAGENPLDNKEIYWNPDNDPATWQHVSQFMVTLGIAGELDFPGDYDNLRLGTATGGGAGPIGWPRPLNNHPTGADDTWHAAVNGRGDYFSASDPDQLVSSLSSILSAILAQSAASTPVSVSLPLITAGTTVYAAAYESSDWSGSVTRHSLDANSQPVYPPLWDAGCLLTGGDCASTGVSTTQLLTPANRRIFTSDGAPGTGKTFVWGSLSLDQQDKLNASPASIDLSVSPATYTADGLGAERVDYLRGDRTRESTGSPLFRKRGSLLGAVIKGQPVYVSSPISGFRDIFPAGSPEQVAAGSGNSYAQYQFDQRARAANIYVGSNDGMLHAFDAATGAEQWAYVPNALIQNLHATMSTSSTEGLVSGVDDAPQQLDVFINDEWRTYLIGSLRLGARGVYAVDVTNPNPGSGSAAASAVPQWEFSNVAPASGGGTDCQPGARFCSSLGYTYDSISVARLEYQNKWVALVSSGYFPESSDDAASADPKARQTSLLVIDLATGTLLKEIVTPTPSSVGGRGVSYGLSTTTVYDLGSNQIDDFAVAGDLAGNLWRFDLRGDVDDWKADLMFTSYDGSVAVGDQPISFNPTAMRDVVNRVPMLIFGTGKYVGKPDRTSSIPQQNYYGVRDYGACGPATNEYGNPDPCTSGIYPITAADLEEQVMTQAPTTGTDGSLYQVRTVTKPATPMTINHGWKILLGSYDNPNSGMVNSPGERAARRAFPFYTPNVAMLFTMVPRTQDPCAPGNDYGFMIVDATTGSFSPSDSSITSATVGALLPASRPLGSPIVAVGGGGESVEIPGIDPALLPPTVGDAIEDALQRTDDVWHRGAWRELLNLF